MATKATPYTYLRGSATQGSADAFVQATITTGLSDEPTRALRVRQLVIGLPVGVEVDSSIEVTFTRKSVAAIAGLSDRHCIFRFQRQLILTTSGQAYQDNLPMWLFTGDEFLIVEPYIYFQVDSTGTSLANSVGYMLACEECTIGRDDRLNLLVASLGT